eukprot:PLAT4311.1.p1 GENE.PLAT4311.1~~PLAT4311.1.p1  ORF type:complete len:589 (-),score=266.68 PLAT4311.1:31-1569(-)
MRDLHMRTKRYIINAKREKMALMELQMEQEQLSEEIHSYSKRLGGVDAVKMNERMIAHHVSVLEARCVKSQNKQMALLARVEELKTAVDAQRQERLILLSARDAMLREMERLESEEKSLHDTIASKMRRRALLLRRMEGMRRQAAAKKDAYEARWLAMSAEAGGVRLPGSRISPEERARQRELARKMKSQSAKETFELEQRLMMRKRVEAKVQSYAEAFRAVRRMFPTDDVTDFAAHYKRMEEQNFHLFSSISELELEAEEMEATLKKLNSEAKQLQRTHLSEDSRRKKILKQIDMQIARASSKVAQLSSQSGKGHALARKVVSGLRSIFTGLDGTERWRAHLPGDTVLSASAITESSLMHYLGMLEQLVLSLLRSQREGELSDAAAAGGDGASGAAASAASGGAASLSAPGSASASLSTLSPAAALPLGLDGSTILHTGIEGPSTPATPGAAHLRVEPPSVEDGGREDDDATDVIVAPVKVGELKRKLASSLVAEVAPARSRRRRKGRRRD